MMLFKKKFSKPTEEGLHQSMIAKKIADRIIKSQMNAAEYLNKKTAHFSTKQKQLLLLGICLFFTAISMYLIINSIN
ncbi:MAG: hypothetical protein EOP00_15110 [Pedobacter sp.]|nr:MAG: hypothetical protein EOP00_15110 [Pedobacter sp.]